jgi:mannose-1-phosphate guanylyltransferase
MEVQNEKPVRCTAMPTMILGAGLGTRLLPLSAWRAKPLVPVGDRAALLHVVERARGRGGPIVVNAHHRAAEIASFVAREAPELRLSVETELLGTAGGIARAAAQLGDGDVLVWNADIIAPLDGEAIRRVTETEATLVVRPGPAQSGNVGVDAGGRVVRLRGEVLRSGETTGGEFLGIHVMGEDLRRLLPARGSIIDDLYLPALRKRAAFGVHAMEAPWFDIGTPATYLEANLAWLGARGAGSWVGERARVASAVTLVTAVVGDGAVVEGRGELARCVVWPGAHAVAPLADAIVAPEGVVRVQTGALRSG